MHVKRLSTFGLSKNLESKYRATTIFVVIEKSYVYVHLTFLQSSV